MYAQVPDASAADAGVGALAITGLDAAAPLLVAAPAAEATPHAVVDVTVRGERNAGRVLQQSAEAVTVVDFQKARQQTADLGEVLARTAGVSVRRSGGLGSEATLSLNGLQGDQIRLFVDGVPAALAGYPFGIVNIPVNLVERVEIYRGVVPIRFGLDALGGAINVVTTNRSQSYANTSYQVGSYGVHRLNGSGRYTDAKSGLFAGGSAFFDKARNDYTVRDLPVGRPDGTYELRDLRMFHNKYRAYGGRAELGVVDKSWARRLKVEGFASRSERDMPTDAVFSEPYGEATSGETTFGGSLHYEVALFPKLELEFLANYTRRLIDFRDVGGSRYRWDGSIARPLGSERSPVFGESTGKAIDERTYEDLVLTRLGLIAPLHANHTARAYVTPQFVRRREHDFYPGRPNYNLVDRAWEIVTGVEYESNWLDNRLSNVAFGKAYWFQVKGEDRQVVASVPVYLDQNRTIPAYGGGDSLRYRFTSWLLAKASYEYAVRLPRPDELFGTGVLVTQSRGDDQRQGHQNRLALDPERSHNANLGPRVELRRTPIGDLVVDINGFWRETRDQILLLPKAGEIWYQNVADARTKGAEGSVFWQSPGRWISLDGTYTAVESFNNSKTGQFAFFKGIRIPNRPYRFANWGARFHVGDLPKAEDWLEVFYIGRYTKGFARFWEDLGNPLYKLRVPTQVAHNIGVTYYQSFDFVRYSVTFEIDNVSDASLFDLWGVQRPGRSFNLKLSAQL